MATDPWFLTDQNEFRYVGIIYSGEKSIIASIINIIAF